MPYTIVMDAGHGGFDNGAQYNGRKEKDEVLDLTLAVGDILESYGFNVIYTRTDDTYESPYEKAMEANATNADLFVSIHRNSSVTPNLYSGVETLVYSNTGLPSIIANNVNAQLEGLGFRNIGISERPNLVVLNSTQMPAVLIEVGFINSTYDNLLFDTKFDEIAYAIADGITMSIYPENYNY